MGMFLLERLPTTVIGITHAEFNIDSLQIAMAMAMIIISERRIPLTNHRSLVFF